MPTNQGPARKGAAKKGPARIFKLPRLLDNSPNLIAVVNDQYQVVFANQSVCDWLQVAAEDLIGTTLKYSTAGEDTQHRFNGICPPPSLFSGADQQSSGQIHCIRDARKVFRSAIFNCIETEDETRTAVLIIAGPRDLEIEAHTEAQTNSLTSQCNWHDLLATLQTNEKRQYRADNVVGMSNHVRKLRRQLAAIIANHEDCLIVGPTGSGRETCARTIFYERNLANAQLVPVHCAIADSESIQNAIKNWVFDRRNNQSADCLLLLDIDCLGVDAQSELLGYTQLPDFQMPLLATSTSDLQPLASEGKYSHALAMYLSVQVVELAALCDRTEDIPVLVQAFIEQANRQSKKQIEGASDDVLEVFTEYHWPRNASELKRYVDAAHDACHSSTIRASDLPEEFHYALSAARIGYSELQPIALTEYLEGIERELISRAIQQSNNNKTKASQMLGISRARLLRRASSLGIEGTPQKNEMIDASEFKEAE